MTTQYSIIVSCFSNRNISKGFESRRNQVWNTSFYTYSAINLCRRRKLAFSSTSIQTLETSSRQKPAGDLIGYTYENAVTFTLYPWTRNTKGRQKKECFERLRYCHISDRRACKYMVCSKASFKCWPALSGDIADLGFQKSMDMYSGIGICVFANKWIADYAWRTCWIFSVPIWASTASPLAITMDFLSDFSLLTSYLVINMTSSEQSTLGQLWTQRMNSFTFTRSAVNIPPNPAICATWKSSKRLLRLMSRVAVTEFKAQNMFKIGEEWKRWKSDSVRKGINMDQCNVENSRGILIWRDVQNS